MHPSSLATSVIRETRTYYHRLNHQLSTASAGFPRTLADRSKAADPGPLGSSVMSPPHIYPNDIKPMIDGIAWLSDADRMAIYEENARAVFTKLVT